MLLFSKKCFISLLALLVLGFLLLIASYFSIAALTEMKISDSYIKSSQGYYLAEAGINEAIWKLKNDGTTLDGDPAWKNEFTTEPNCQNFSASFTRTNILYPNSSYTVSIKNLECAKGEIVATAKITLGGEKEVQRVVKTKVFKARNQSPVAGMGIFAGGTTEDISFLAGLMNLYNGSIFSNRNLDMQLASTLNVPDGYVLTVNNIYKSLLSDINSDGMCPQKYCDIWGCRDYCSSGCSKCPPDSITMPMIDFDSNNPYDGVESYKEKAQAAGTLYTSAQFENMLWNNANLTLNNEVTYVTGPITLRGNRNLTVNGILVADGTISIGEELCWIRGWFPWPCGNSKITINHTSGKPSGILTKGKISVGLYANQINITGLVYANDEFSLASMPQSFNITGGMIARKLSLVSIWQALNVTLNDEIVREATGLPTYSPVVQVEHWEETY